MIKSIIKGLLYLTGILLTVAIVGYAMVSAVSLFTFLDKAEAYGETRGCGVMLDPLGLNSITCQKVEFQIESGPVVAHGSPFAPLQGQNKDLVQALAGFNAVTLPLYLAILVARLTWNVGSLRFAPKKVLWAAIHLTIALALGWLIVKGMIQLAGLI